MVENFNGPSGAPPDPNLWSPVVGTGWDAGVEKYLPENAVLDGAGNLAIRAEQTDDGYTSGRVQTKDRIDFGYGTLTARIKMPSGQGLWPAFWLVGADESTNPWPGAGEIDIAEFASDPNQFHATLHGPIEDSERKYQQAQITYAGEDLTEDFHDYWMDHQLNSITVGVDDTELGTFTPESIPPDATWVYNKPFYAILNLAVGGEWAGPPDASTQFPATMLVDSIRWQPS
ncbi:MAG: glycoside hydrolase family 16 protein [Mycobacterium sp.]|nr:glycoside hydrolase family 16 protein [Mycobacterium sp.]